MVDSLLQMQQTAGQAAEHHGQNDDRQLLEDAPEPTAQAGPSRLQADEDGQHPQQNLEHLLRGGFHLPRHGQPDGSSDQDAGGVYGGAPHWGKLNHGRLVQGKRRCNSKSLQLQHPPEIPGGRRTIRAPTFAEPEYVARFGQRPPPIHLLKALPHAVIG
jgi:hypothetical protein